MDAHFGFFRMSTTVENISRWRIEGPWSWFTAIGVRRGIFRADVSFDGNHKGGVRLDFLKPVKWGPFHPPILYVTVADLEGFAAALTARGIPGEDAREEVRQKRSEPSEEGPLHCPGRANNRSCWDPATPQGHLSRRLHRLP